MHLVYDSLTGNVRRLAHILAERAGGLAVQDVKAPHAGGDFLLLTYTFHRGEVPDSTRAFLSRAAPGLRGVVASGSYHWGANFARAADLIAAAHAVPVVAKLNKGGTEADLARILAWLDTATPALRPPDRPTPRPAGGAYGTLD